MNIGIGLLTPFGFCFPNSYYIPAVIARRMGKVSAEGANIPRIRFQLSDRASATLKLRGDASQLPSWSKKYALHGYGTPAEQTIVIGP